MSKHRESDVLDRVEVTAEIGELEKIVEQETPGIQPEVSFDMATEFKKMQEELAALKSSGVAKNHKAGIPKTTKYVRLGTMKTFGRVPQQQADIASILTAAMPIGEEFTEEQVFKLVVDGAPNYPQLRNSRQHPTYLFRYYRGLKSDGKHAGMIARDFLKQV